MAELGAQLGLDIALDVGYAFNPATMAISIFSGITDGMKLYTKMTRMHDKYESQKNNYRLLFKDIYD